jgi:putative cardiolipin synthase
VNGRARAAFPVVLPSHILPIVLRRAFDLQRLAILLGALLVTATGCATLPRDVAREPSHAWDRPQETELGRALAADVGQHPGMSGFHLLGSGLDAFVARVALAGAAERTLDLQYYIFHDDLTGKLILDNVLSAADRGVRVRILLDDTTAKGKDAGIAVLSSHPHIEVRVFNPFAGRSSASWLFSAVADFDRINHRMHNKMFVADNQAGVVGGRNIGDEYFSAREGVNFADMDLLAVGPVVQDLSRSFDGYWNSEWAYPIEALHSSETDPAAQTKGREMLTAHRLAAQGSEYARRLRESDLLTKLLAHDLPLVWAPAHVVVDRPDKVASAETPTAPVRLGSRLRPVVENAQNELIISSPYFIPGKNGIRFFEKLRNKGVRVRILTNSFAGNDVAVVHSGYAKYRKDLLRLGVELHELKPSLAAAPEKEREHFGSSGASLHAKAFIIDREQVFVGSLNLDPRSVDLNTELGIIVESPGLADELARQFEGLLQPVYSYRLSLDKADEDLVWTSEENGREVRYTRDPDVGFWRRFSTWFLSFFAPESLL